MARKILLIEDEEKIARFTELELVHEGYEVTKAFNGREGLELAEKGGFDLVLLDVMLPELNGLEVLRRLRRSSQVPVIMLTARDAVMDKVSGLDAGADDYITKPFAIEELLARIRVAFKKQDGVCQQTHRMTVCGVTVDTDRHEVTCQGETIELTNREYELIRTLMVNKNIVMNREKLLAFWSCDSETEQTIGMPFLSEVPLLKYLFGTTTTGSEHTLYFMTVRAEFVHPDAELAAGAGRVVDLSEFDTLRDHR